MLGQPNRAVALNDDLMEEIKRSQHQREYDRGLRPDPPAPLNKPKPVYSNHQMSSQMVGSEPNHIMSMGDEVSVSERMGASNLKEKSISSMPAGGATNRTTVPSQINGNACDQSTTSMLLQE